MQSTEHCAGLLDKALGAARDQRDRARRDITPVSGGSSELAAERCAAAGRRSAFVSHAVSGVGSEKMHPPKHVSADRRRHLIGDLTGHAARKQDVQADH